VGGVSRHNVCAHQCVCACLCAPRGRYPLPLCVWPLVHSLRHARATPKPASGSAPHTPPQARRCGVTDVACQTKEGGGHAQDDRQPVLSQWFAGSPGGCPAPLLEAGQAGAQDQPVCRCVQGVMGGRLGHCTLCCARRQHGHLALSHCCCCAAVVLWRARASASAEGLAVAAAPRVAGRACGPRALLMLPPCSHYLSTPPATEMAPPRPHTPVTHARPCGPATKTALTAPASILNWS
jgi:hypothetical protein